MQKKSEIDFIKAFEIQTKGFPYLAAIFDGIAGQVEQMITSDLAYPVASSVYETGNQLRGMAIERNKLMAEKSAIRAAEIITGKKSGSTHTFKTSYGYKTVEGIAAVIDDQTAAAQLLAALKACRDELAHYRNTGKTIEPAERAYTLACAAITEAEGN